MAVKQRTVNAEVPPRLPLPPLQNLNLHFKHCTLHPTLHTLHPAHYTLHPAPFTTHPAPCIRQGYLTNKETHLPKTLP